MPTQTIEEKKAARSALLNKLYDECAGSPNRKVDLYRAGQSIGLDKAQAMDIYTYWKGEGLVEGVAAGLLRLTHEGIKEIETQRSHPNDPTEYLPAMNVTHNWFQNNGTISGSTVQQVGVGSADGSSVASLIEFAKVLRALLETKPSTLDAEVVSALTVLAETIESLSGRDSPKPSLVRAALASIKELLVGISSNVLASQLTTMIPPLMAMYS